jgi:hypothetical protein
VFSTLEGRKITQTLESGNRIEAETSSNAAAGFCPREATAGGLRSREMLAKKINTGTRSYLRRFECMSGTDPDVCLRDRLQNSGL